MVEQLGLFDVHQGMYVEPIDRMRTVPFIMNIHYARRMPQIQYAFGLFNEEGLIGVVTYGQPASPNLCRGLAGGEQPTQCVRTKQISYSS